jgi:hypothetical protein
MVAGANLNLADFGGRRVEPRWDAAVVTAVADGRTVLMWVRGGCSIGQAAAQVKCSISRAIKCLQLALLDEAGQLLELARVHCESTLTLELAEQLLVFCNWWRASESVVFAAGVAASPVCVSVNLPFRDPVPGAVGKVVDVMA